MHIEYSPILPKPTSKQALSPVHVPNSNGKSIDPLPLLCPDEQVEHLNSPIDIVHNNKEIRSLKESVIYPDNELKQELKQEGKQEPIPDDHIPYTNKSPIIEEKESFPLVESENGMKPIIEVETFSEISTPVSKRKKRIKISTPSTHAIGEIFEAYGYAFTIKKIYKTKDENSIVRCELCERDFKKKSIRSHAQSLLHKSKIS